MFAVFVKLVVILALLYLQSNIIMPFDNDSVNEDHGSVTIDTFRNVAKYFETVMVECGRSLGTQFMNGLNAVYAHLTIVNLIVFLFKYVSTTLFMYKYIKSCYTTTRERLRRMQSQFEDMKLQVKIVTTKISVREAEVTERSEHLHRALERLRKVRARVREIIAGNEELRRDFDNTSMGIDNAAQNIPEQEQKVILELMKELKFEHSKLSEVQADNMEYGEFIPAEPSSPEASIYSSASESQKECQVKIVKVTNVYKVSYLRHFIKQKRLRRASKQALLKRKMEDIKKLLEDWQKTLNMVINSKLAIVDIDPNRMEIASQEAMGDYTKPHLRESSDTDSDLSWNPYRNIAYCFQDSPEMGMDREYYEPGDQDETIQPADIECDWGRPKLGNNLFMVTEETSSQLAIQEVKSEVDDDWDCRDINSV